MKTKIIFTFLALAILILASPSLFILITGYNLALAKTTENQNDYQIVSLKSDPINLPAKKQGNILGEDFYPRTGLVILNTKGWIVDFKPKVIGAPGEVLHHSAIGYSFQEDPFCPKLKQTLAASGSELTDLELPSGYGIKVSSPTVLFFITHWRNNTNQSFQNVSFEYDLKILKDNPDLKIKEVKPFLLSVVPCTFNRTYPVPPKTIASSRSETFTSPVNGNFVLLYGHLHHKSMEINLEVNSKKVWSSFPAMEGENLILPVAYPKVPLIVNKGDKLKLTSIYSNPSKTETLDAMAILMAYYIPK